MNYLAHIYLSGDDEDIKIGNFIADFIYGNQYHNFSINIQKGILLHRHIDTFTDSHLIFRQSKKKLFPEFRHYSAVIVDMFYDHFLAKNFDIYSSESLEDFADNFYGTLYLNKAYLPDGVQKILPVMSKYNWLVNYRNLDGLQSILKQMNRRTKHDTALHLSIKTLENNYSLFENEFILFFDDMLKAQAKMFKDLKIN